MATTLDKYRELSEKELLDEETRLTDQAFKLRIQKAKGQLENPQRIKMVRRDIARLKTLLRERELASAKKTEA